MKVLARASAQAAEDRKSLQEPVGGVRQPARQERDAGQDQKPAHGALHEGETGVHALYERGERLHREGREEERDAESGGIDREEDRSLGDARLRARHGQDGGEGRADAGRPPEGEREAHYVRSPQADRAGHVEPGFPVKEPNAETAEEMESHRDDGDAGNRAEHREILPDVLAGRRGGGANKDEHRREAGHEEQRSEHGPPSYGPVI